MRFLLRMVPAGESGQAVRNLKSLASNIGGRAVNAKTTSYGAVEVDVFVPSRSDFELFVAAVEPLGRVEFQRDLQEPSRPMTPAQSVAEAVNLFDKERFFEAHEVLESLWRTAEGKERTLLQGLILVCAAFVHEQKDEPFVALSIIERAMPKLKWEGNYHGLNVGALRSALSVMLQKKKLHVLSI